VDANKGSRGLTATAVLVALAALILAMLPVLMLGVARGSADRFADTHASQTRLLHEYLHPTIRSGRRCGSGSRAENRQSCLVSISGFAESESRT
jgi:hypothetical protein